MKTVIYYFTGTGNSLSVAQKICAGLSDCERIPVASLDGTTGTIAPAADRVGIVCPVYFAGLPAMVARFASRLDLSRAGYTFAVVTFGGSGAGPTLRQLDGILRATSGRGLDAGYAVKMPGNNVLLYAPPEGEKRDRILAAADGQVAKIIKTIDRGIMQELPRFLPTQLLHALMYPRFIRTVHDADRQFSVSDACTSCGTCVAVCPAGNIELVDKKPVWQHRCELCCACIQLCPVQAIQAGKKTETRGRYRNPAVPVAELKLRAHE
jgi:ferredoxin